MISLSLLTCCLAPLAWHCRAAGGDEIVVPEELVHRATDGIATFFFPLTEDLWLSDNENWTREMRKVAGEVEHGNKTHVHVLYHTACSIHVHDCDMTWLVTVRRWKNDQKDVVTGSEGRAGEGQPVITCWKQATKHVLQHVLIQANSRWVLQFFYTL